MGKSGLSVNKKDLSSLENKFKALDKLCDGLGGEVAKQSDAMVNAARSDFSARALPVLRARGEQTAGFASSIVKRRVTGVKGSTTFNIGAGGVGKKVMAFIEFGTRRRVDLSDVRNLLGAKGAKLARGFKGGNNPKNFTHLEAKPYFFHNIFKRRNILVSKSRRRINSILKK